MLNYIKYSILFLFVLFASYVAYFWGGAIYKTFHIVMNMSSDSPEWVSDGNYEVDFQKITLSKNKGSGLHIYRPEGAGKTAFIIFVPGFTDKGASDERVIRLSRSFAESGIGVAALETDSMQKRIFDTDDIDEIVSAFRYLENQDYVKDGRIAIGGFSIAGSYSIIAASEPDIEPLFVFSFGGYFDLKELVASIISEQAVYRGNSRKWKPSAIPVAVVSKLLGEELIEQSPVYEDALDMLDNVDSIHKQIFEKLSPSTDVNRISSQLYVIHSADDDSIPVEHSYMLMDSLPAGTDASFTELSDLSHVTPKDFFSYDYLKLSWQVLRMVKQLD